MRKFLTTISYFALTATAFGQSGRTPSGGSSGITPGGGSSGVTPGSSNPFELPNPLRSDSIIEILDGIAYFLLIISVPLAALIVVWGAFQILTSAGNEEAVKKGKKTIIYAVVGLGIILLFRVIMALLFQLISGL